MHVYMCESICVYVCESVCVYVCAHAHAHTHTSPQMPQQGCGAQRTAEDFILSFHLVGSGDGSQVSRPACEAPFLAEPSHWLAP